MASIKVLLYTSKVYADGTHPVVIQIIDKSVYRKVIYKCKPQYWDIKQSRLKSTAPNAQEINKLINLKLLEYEKSILQLKEDNKIITKDVFQENEPIRIVEVSTRESERLEKLNKIVSSKRFKSLANQLSEFRNSELSKIDKNWLDDYVLFLKEADNTEITIMKKISQIKSLIDRYSNGQLAFEVKNYRIPILNESLKQKLTKEELDRIVLLSLPINDRVSEVRDFFLLQIYLRGVRVGDLLQAGKENFENERFVYKSDKTGTNYDIALIPNAKEIVDKYSEFGHEKLFSFWKFKNQAHKSKIENEKLRLKHKESCTSVINKFLKLISQMAGIDKQLSSHVARHTFAMLADEAIGGNVAVVQQMLGHSKRSTTEKYIKSLRKTEVLDRAADDIFREIL